MADVLVLVQLLMMMIVVVMKKSSSAEITPVSVNSSDPVLLPSGLQVEEKEHRWDDIRWIHHRQLSLEKNGTTWQHRGCELVKGMMESWDNKDLLLVVSLKRNMTTCDHRRCELLSDGSLRFSRVQTEDSGNYSLEVFYKNGTVRIKTHFQLRVKESKDKESDCRQSDSQTDNKSLLICCLLLFLFLLLFFIIFFILRRRRNKKKKISGPNEENVYVSMHGHHGNKRKDEDKEEPTYVSMETFTK